MQVFLTILTFFALILLLMAAAIVVGCGFNIGASLACKIIRHQPPPLLLVIISIRDTRSKFHMQNDDILSAIKTAKFALKLLEENKKLKAELNERKNNHAN